MTNAQLIEAPIICPICGEILKDLTSEGFGIVHKFGNRYCVYGKVGRNGGND